MELNNSIRKIRKSLGLTQEQFASELGIKRSLIGAYEEGRAEPRLELLHKIAKMGGLSLESLVADEMPVNQFSKVSYLKADNIEKAGNIQLVPVKAAAGYLSGFGDDEVIKELPNFSLPMLNNGSYRAFEIWGDSMLPLASGTIVVGEQLEKLNGLKSGKTYVLVTKRDGIVYKRVFNYLKENGRLFLVSDNAQYKPYAIEPEEILEAWAAKAYISVQFPDNEVKFNPPKAS
jgi:transcriptional regulator with XRE-family HTH domain